MLARTCNSVAPGGAGILLPQDGPADAPPPRQFIVYHRAAVECFQPRRHLRGV